MRNAFATSVAESFNKEDCFFLTGDLGFMALENIQGVFGQRFINMGVSEQNMIGVAAGLAKEGMKVIVYSIAPFCYARPYEQIRNDICPGNLPVCLVGNGGGYAYGYMGPTHHALEDCVSMAALGVRVLVPAFDDDIQPMLNDITVPTYLRLGYDARPKNSFISEYAAWRKLLPGKNGVLIALGPLAGVAWSALLGLSEAQRPAIWAVTELPLCELPLQLIEDIESAECLYVIEEHVAVGGVGMQLTYELTRRGINVNKICHRFAVGYPNARYGSQAYHREQSGLDADGILKIVFGNTHA